MEKEQQAEAEATSSRPSCDFPAAGPGGEGAGAQAVAAAAGEAPGDRPSDEEILMQQNRIRAEEAQRHEYVGNMEPMAALKAEYINGNEVFVTKIEKLESSYASFRRTRGDGNCFFRGFVFSYLESLLHTRDLMECNRLSVCIQDWKQKLVEGGFQELVFEDAMELLLDQIREIQKPGASSAEGHDQLMANMRDDTVSNMIVMFLRLVTSCEVQRREDHFFPFILGMYDEPPATVDMFCQRYVQPLGEESDHLHIVAITDALQVPVRIVYLDRSGAMGESSDLEVTTHDFVPDCCASGTVPRVHLLYRPGHYDILYAKGG